jgi:hypothetical protein
MHLTEFQRSLTKDMFDGRITNIESYLKLHIKTNQEISKGAVYGAKPMVMGNKPIYVMIDENEAIRQIKEFISLVSELEKARLVLSIEIERPLQYPLFNKSGEYSKLPNLITQQFAKKEIIPLPGLSTFIHNNYQTEEEIDKIEETRHRKTNLSLTRKVAYISLGISILLSVTTMVFNYFIYTTDRTVLIKNSNAFSDTTKVVIVSSSIQKVDSIRALQNKK